MRAGIGLGSNLGDRVRILQHAIHSLHQLSDLPTADRVSSLYETSPVDCAPGTPAFLNAVMEIETGTSPIELLSRLQSLEVATGRPPIRAKNEPRRLDLDLLYVDQLTWNDAKLTLPHPLMLERQFVLAPLAEIAPDLILPAQTLSIAELWKARAILDKNYIIKIIK